MEGIWARRAELARLRMKTDLRISKYRRDDKNVGVGFWISSPYWGDLIAEVSIHSHGVLEAGCTLNDVEAIVRKVFSHAYNNAVRARMDFPNSVPCQVVDEQGKTNIVLNSWSDKSAREHQRKRGYDKSSFPPIDEDLLPRPEEGPEYDDGIFRLVHQGVSDEELHFAWEDNLTPYGESRYYRDAQPCTWQYGCRPRIISDEGQELIMAKDVRVPVSVVKVPDGRAALSCAMRHIDEIRADFIKSRPSIPEQYRKLSDAIAEYRAERGEGPAG